MISSIILSFFVFFSNVFSGRRDELVITVQEQREARDKWWFDQQRAQDEIVLTLHSPPDAVVGHYRLAVVAKSPFGHVVDKADKMGFHLLFNPWCKGQTNFCAPTAAFFQLLSCSS